MFLKFEDKRTLSNFSNGGHHYSDRNPNKGATKIKEFMNMLMLSLKMAHIRILALNKGLVCF